MRIIPAILEKTTDQFIEQLHRLHPYFAHFHIDIADGQLVPNNTPRIEDFIQLVKNKPQSFHQKIFDFHLMIEDFQSVLEKLQKLSQLIKINTVFIHLTPFERSKLKLSNFPFHLGIVLNPADEVLTNWEAIQRFSAVQIMSVHPGFQGTPFLPKVLNKITQLRQHGFEGIIYLDGGINEKTVSLILQNKNQPDVLCIGSYFRDNLQEKLHIFQSMLHI